VSLLRLALDARGAAGARLATAFWTAIAWVRLRAHGARIGRGLRVRGPLRLHCHRTASILIGRGCRIQSGFAGNAVGGNGRMALWVGAGAVLTIGDGVGLSNATIVCLRAVTIGDGVLVGGDSKVYDTDFHSLDAAERARPGNPGARRAPVTIGPRAFVGAHSVVLKGAEVGAEAVIGAGAVVRGTVPAGEVWAGNPAVPLRGAPRRGRAPLEAVR
jgi:acetyltransferase-like isoleucine patch superfamily enzyme